jgi:hypothetical protein
MTALAIALGVAVSACAPATQTAGTPSARRTLLGDEIRAASVVTAYEAVARLRPEWLRRRGQISVRDPGAGDVLVYLDGMHYGSARALNTIRAEGVLQMEFLSGPEATMRFGTGHAGGAILVQTR